MIRLMTSPKHLNPKAEVPLFGNSVGAPLVKRLYPEAPVPCFGNYIADPLFKAADPEAYSLDL